MMSRRWLCWPVLCLAPCYGTETGIAYSRILGAARITATVVDAGGNVYLTGSTEDATFPVTPGVVQPAFGGGTCVSYNNGPLNPVYYPCDDAIVVKLDSQGNVVFATFLGGAGLDTATAIAVDAGGNIYVAGNTSPSSQAAPNNFPLTPGAAFPFDSARALTGEGFLTKLNPSGTALVYSTLIPGGVSGIAVDGQANAWFTGTAEPGQFPATAGAFQATGGGGTDAILGKLNAAGSALVYGTYLGGSSYEYAGGIVLDAAGDAYVRARPGRPTFPRRREHSRPAGRARTCTAPTWRR